jgi:hypothetical protein
MSFDETPGGRIIRRFHSWHRSIARLLQCSSGTLVPPYLGLSSGRIMRLGSGAITGNRTMEQKIPLAGLKEKPKRTMLNYFNDVLCAW